MHPTADTRAVINPIGAARRVMRGVGRLIAERTFKSMRVVRSRKKRVASGVQGAV